MKAVTVKVMADRRGQWIASANLAKIFLVIG